MSSIRYQTVDHKIHKIDYADDIKEINLSLKKIQKIIKIDGMSTLQKLDLYGNQITRIEGLNSLSALQYLNLSGNQITRIEGLNSLTALQHLDLSDNKITRIEGLNSLTALQTLWLYENQITHIEGLNGLTALRHLNLSENQIIRIEGFDSLTALQHLNLSRNKITRIEGLNSLTALQHLDLSENKITRIEGLNSLTALQNLYLSGNQITRIEGLNSSTSLQTLLLSGNQITHIEGLNRLNALQNLWLSGNKITHIENLNSLTALQYLYIEGNLIKEVPMTIMLLRNLSHLYVGIEYNPIIRRFLTRNSIRSNQTVYDDTQNVHNSQINHSITQSLYRLMEQKLEMSEQKVIDEILGDPILTKQVKEQIIEYVRIADVHSSLNVTFLEALRTVWQVIRKHPEANEIKRILNQEINDSYCRCFTGRLSRLVNCLNGFDPRVSVKISDQQEIANLIIAIRQKYQKIEEQIDMAKKELSERGYDKQTIDEWIGYLE